MRVETIRESGPRTWVVGLSGVNTERFRKVTLTSADLQQLQIQKPHFTYDGDGQVLKIGVQAYSLGIAYEFDPYFGLSISRVDPLPHQLEAVYDYLLKLARVRFLLADDAGAGKTIMAGLLIRELKLRGLAERVLIICPANLTFQWQRELKEKFEEKFVVLKGDLIREQFGINQWLETPMVITSLDLAKRDNILPGLKQVRWDLVIVDEAHRMSWTPPSKKTARYALGELLRDSSDNLLLLTATPHKGDPTNFSLFLQLLDEDAYADVKSIREAMDRRRAPFYLRRTKEAMVYFPQRMPDGSWEAKKIFTKRIPHTVDFHIDGAEDELYREVTAFVKAQSNRAAANGDDPRARAVRFLMALYQRRLASSTYALRRSLENRGKRLTEMLKKAQEIARYAPLDLPDMEELDEMEDSERERLEDMIAAVSLARNPDQVKDEIEELKGLVEHAIRVEDAACEAKLSRLQELLKQQGFFDNPQQRLLIFTEFKDTLDYLVKKLREWNFTVGTIHGGMHIGSRDEAGTRLYAEQQFREGATQVLVATEAAGEGINLQCCNILFNYDIPWNPNRLEQRMGRIHRYLQTKDCLIFNFVATNTIEGHVLQKLLDKLQEIRAQVTEEPKSAIKDGGLSFTNSDLVKSEQRFCKAIENPTSQLSEFLRQRGITRIVAQQLRFGFMPNHYFACGQKCTNCGERPALVIPRFWNGELLGLKYRSLDPPNKEHKWSQECGSKTDFFYAANLQPTDADSHVVGVLEGELDTALVRSLGFNAVGILGANSIPSEATPRFRESIDALKESYDHVLLIGDMDDVGEEAMHNLCEQIGRGCIFSRVPGLHKDVGELLAAEGETHLRDRLQWAYSAASEATPIPRGTRKEYVTDILSNALRQLDDGEDSNAVVSAVRADLRAGEEQIGFPAPLGQDAFQGIFGQIVREGLPHTEADESCLLYQIITALGNLQGRRSYASFGTDKHFANLFTLIVGRTNSGKGQGLSQVRSLINPIDPRWSDSYCKYSASSGEALVRMLAESEQECDGRLLLVMPELSVLLNSMNREGSNTSGYLRLGYDGLPMENQRSKGGVCARNYLLSVLGHITPEELSEIFQAVDWQNGVANRFIWAAVRPSKVLPRMTTAPDFSAAQQTIRKLLALPSGKIDFAAGGVKQWDEWVYSLPNLEGRLALSQARVRPNALRIAAIYALYDEERLTGIHFAEGADGSLKAECVFDPPRVLIESRHVDAAIQIVTRSRQTVEWYLTNNTSTEGVVHMDVVKVRLEANRKGGRLTGTELNKLFSHRTTEQRIELASRAGLKLRKLSSGEKGGKPPDLWTF